MPLEPRAVSGILPEESLGSLRSCLVEGDAEQRHRERHVRRRALFFSILIQTAVLALLILIPLFGKTERVALAIATPIPPYSPYRGIDHPPTPTQPRGRHDVCRICAPPTIPPTIFTHDTQPLGENPNEPVIEGLLPGISGSSTGLIPLGDARRRGPEPVQEDHRNDPPRVVHMTDIDPALLIHRVEPVYPPLPRQIHKEGRVELRAIIATDGTIQSLEIVAGDPMFYQSAKEAVSRWRYKPTILNGQPVEIDTYITVIYTLQH